MLERIFAVSFWTTFLTLFISPVAHRYRTNIYEPRVIEYTNRDVGLFPRIFNLAKHANISVNGTCGANRPEVFCRRPTDKEARKANQCIPTLCDPKRNGIRKAIDGSKDSWISPTLENGLEYEYITITLDMKQVYQVVYVTIKAGMTPLPAAWVLERSTDGVEFSPWQYFAENDAECRRRFGMAATQGKPHFKTDNEIICLINYSKLFYIENGEIHISLLNGRPGSNFSSEILKNFTLARYVRFRLQKMYKTEKDLLLRKKLFYSVKTISIGGQCLCHGHAAKCTPNKITGLPTCECEHNTCGKHCEECCPLHNQILWSPGTFESAGKCEECQCHGHSDSCIFNSQLSEKKLSLDINGNYRGGGECVSCKNHTVGINCERCEEKWYRPQGTKPDDSVPCLPCDCHPRGSTGSCVQDSSDPNKSAGMCECREGFAGLKCDECAPGWRNFPNCEPCPCDPRGSLNREVCSIPCVCKINVEGKYCDKCRRGYFGLDALNTEGCTKCYCSGITETCKEANATQISIEPPLEGWLITDLSAINTIIPTEDPDSSALYIGNYELPGIESYYWLAPPSFCGNQIAAYGGTALSFNVGWEAMRGDTSGQPTVGPNVILVGANGVRLGLGEETFEERKGNATLKAPFREEVWYTIPPEVKDIRTRLRRTEYRGATITRDKLLGVLANVKHVMLRAKFHTDQVEGSLISVRMEPVRNENDSRIYFLEKCECPSQYAGFSCESCAFSHYKNLNSSFDIPFQCVPCSCNSHSECDYTTGFCKKCEHNTQGDQCEFCMSGFYGNATEGSPDDCKPCACPLLNPSNNFSPTCEVMPNDSNETTLDDYFCTECPMGYTGIYCETCEESYYGNPLEIGGSCQPCDCDGAPCDNITGECLECSGNMEGFRCENCKPNTYKISNSSCGPCDCDAQGSEIESCDVETGQCECKNEYKGRTCNQCANGYTFFDGICEKCDCGIGAESEICDPVNGDCKCQDGVLPPKCSECTALHFGISSEGCKVIFSFIPNNDAGKEEETHLHSRGSHLNPAGEAGKNISLTKNSHLPDALDKFYNHSYHSNTSASHRRRKVRRRRLQNKLNRYAGEEGHSFGSNSRTGTSAIASLHSAHYFPPDDKQLVGTTIIKTSDDNKRQGMLIQSIMSDSKPGIRYFQNNLPLGKGRKSHYERLSTTPRPETGVIYILPNNLRRKNQWTRPPFNSRKRPGVHRGNHTKEGQRNSQPGTPRYGVNYLNWRGLRFGCDCHGFGAEHPACDIITGQCPCRPNVTGRACDQCLTHHWGISLGFGCRPCDCDAIGSLSPSCDFETGQCFCKPGVGGSKCDKCISNHFGFSVNGCAKCQECKLLGHICDPDTGRCICPPHTQGVHCQSCTPNSWGYEILKGCKPCNCDSGGSSSSQCNFHTGNCSCRTGFRGAHCDSCNHGYYNFPFCKACNCDYAGTLNETCDPTTGMCQCDENGACQCKPNVTGKKCNVCKNGTFGIQAENPNGCTACFCFGRSASCTQAGLRWSQIRAGRSRTVFIKYDSSSFKNSVPVNAQEICYVNLAVPGGKEITLNAADRGWNVTNNLRTIPGFVEDVKIGVSFLFDSPVYWRLPHQFLGDKVLSYGGYLKFLVETEGGTIQLPPTVLSTYPLVQLQGNSKIVLEHYPLLAEKRGRYEVRFHESLWRDKYHPDKKVSRETFMVALQNIQHILIRASDSVDFKKAIFKDVTLDTAAASNGLALAGGVELCECPPEYNSTSCQDPSIGFYRWYDKDVNTATILIQLIGEAKPCECNNRSEICDIETGFCQDCAFNTEGPKCERCKEGYYGDPSTGPCLSCPCPKPERNFAVGCHVYSGRDPVCKCKKGYTGRFCDRCAYGWFGYPEREGGFCLPCECNVYGSASDECDEKTGQCNCRPETKGRDCSVCTGRRVLTQKGCSTCEHGCTGILLKDFDNLTKELVSRVNEALSSAEPPWDNLKEIEKKLTIVKKALQEWEETTKTFDNLIESNIPIEIKTTVKNLVQKAHKLDDRSKMVKTDAAFVRNQSDSFYGKLQNTLNDIEKAVENLNIYSEDRKSVVSDSVALVEAKQLLEEIMKRDFQPHKQEAEQILDFCTGVLNKTMHMNERFPEIWDLKETFENILGKLEELENYIKKAVELTGKTNLGDQRDRIRYLKKKLEEINVNLEEIENIRNEADGLLYDADLYLTEFDNNIYNISSAIKGRLMNATQSLYSKEGIYKNLNPLYRNKYVKPAQMHAAHLAKKATELKNLFNATIKDASIALEAAKAYQDIIDDLEAAKKAAKEAIDSELMYKVFPSEFDETILKKSNVVKALSTRLINKGTSQNQHNADLGKKLEEEKFIVEKIKETIRQTGIADNKLSDELETLENIAVKEQVQAALNKTENLERQMNKANEKTEMIKSDLITKLRPQLKDLLEEEGLNDLERAHKNIVGSLAHNRRTSELFSKINKTIFVPSMKEKPFLLLPNLLENLKNKITEARHAAQSIRLSLSSNSTRGCVRSFKVFSLEPTTATRLVVTLTVDPIIANRIIFFLPSSSTNDFMALELVDGSIRFVWNNGGGPGVVSKNLMEETKKNGPQWFKIVVERISYVARLWVYTDNSKLTDVKPVSNASSPTFGRLDISPNDKIWIGGLPSNYERPSEILSLQQGLLGCLHNVILDDKPIGLWNHFTDSTDSCSACETGKDDIIDGSSYSFNGKGYSVLKHAPKSIYNRYQFSVALKFKTYDDNSVLFLAISADKSRYASLILRDGRVIFQIGYGGESQLEMSSTRKYNDGNWTLIEASRNFDRRRKIEKGLLKVGDEMKEAAPPTPPLQSQIPELATADYLVGGFPPGYNFGSLSLRIPKPFLGCLTEIFIDKDIYNPLRGKTNGVGSSCTDKIMKTAGFHGKGFLKLEATKLKKDSDFGLALRTLQASGLVLLANGIAQKSTSAKDMENDISNVIESKPLHEERKKGSYYSISLVDGRVEVRIDAGKGTSTLVSQTICNDGRFHSISVAKMGRKLELRVDDEFQSASTLPGGAITVKAKDLYLGGTPEDIDASVYASAVVPFTGTIKDLLFNYELKQFNNPIDFIGVDIGRLGPEKTDNMTFIQTTKLPPQNHFHCYRSRKYALDPRAVKFGDSLNSHIQMNLRRRGIFQKNYTVEFKFRTFHPNGVLFIIPGTNKSGKQKNYLLSAIRNGQLQLIVKAKKKLEVTEEKRLNNGTWQNVLISRVERRLTMLVNGQESKRLKLPKRVNLSNILFIGGIPESGISDPFILKLPGFTGCLKNLKINNQTEDLIGEKSLHQGVGQCFPNVEKGSFFSGDAYVAYKNDFTIESLLKIELEFRTSEMNGVLLGISNFIGQPTFSLEINNGKIIFIGDVDGNHKFRLLHEFISEYVVCDNKWHRIHTMYESNQLIMRVDQTDVKLDLPRADFLNIIVSAPLYIGGLPEHIPGGRPILETRGNFKGCMRNIVLGDKAIDFTEISMRHNVLIGSCPANNNH